MMADPILMHEWAEWVRQAFGDEAGDLARVIAHRWVNINWPNKMFITVRTQSDWTPWIFDRQEPVRKETVTRWHSDKLGLTKIPDFDKMTLDQKRLWILRYASDDIENAPTNKDVWVNYLATKWEILNGN
jgi:hypothetical protein